MLKAYKYRIHPNEEQKEMFAKHFGCTRWIFNWALNKKIEEYKETGKSPNWVLLAREIKNLRVEYPWLAEIACQSLHTSLRNLDRAYKAFFKQQNRFPAFKSKSGRQSFQNHGYGVGVKDGCLKMPKMDPVEMTMHRDFVGRVINVTVSKEPSGKYYASLTVEDGLEYPKKMIPSKERSIGIRYGINEEYFAMLSNGEVIENLKPLTKSAKKIKRLQRRLSKKVKGSHNKEKQRIKLATAHGKVASQRHDFLHKLSRKVVDNYESICLKDEKIKKILEEETTEKAKKLADSSFGIFKSMLIYKSDWVGKETRLIKTKEDLSADEILDAAFDK